MQNTEGSHVIFPLIYDMYSTFALKDLLQTRSYYTVTHNDITDDMGLVDLSYATTECILNFQYCLKETFTEKVWGCHF